MIPSDRLRKEIEIPEGISVDFKNRIFTVSKADNSVARPLYYPTIEVKLESNKIVIEPKKCSKREKKMINTFAAHIKNMIEGVEKPYEYKVKICSSHFPMNVAVKENKIVIKNFLGEKIPREAVIRPNVKAKIEGDDVVIISPDKEAAGQTAANCESATRITNRDRRIFQDGLWINQKGDRMLS
jgi:large subunit ribosomal protein L6